jgi:hypothetical protein
MTRPVYLVKDLIGLTGGGANDPQRASLAALIAVEGAICATGATLVRISTRRHVLPRAAR